MSSLYVTTLLWAAALSSAIMAGVYFAFSGFIMQSFNKLSASQAVAAMNVINVIIVRSVFMPLFFGSTMVTLFLIIAGIFYWAETGAGLMMVAGLVYFIGMFICTAIFNVPLNNMLASLEPDNENLPQLWSHYFKTWTNWNHLRAVSSLVTCVICIWLLSGNY